MMPQGLQGSCRPFAMEWGSLHFLFSGSGLFRASSTFCGCGKQIAVIFNYLLFPTSGVSEGLCPEKP